MTKNNTNTPKNKNEDDLSAKERLEVRREIAKAKAQEAYHTVKSEFRNQTAAAIIAAFGLVIALSWQTVIREITDSIPKTAFIQKYPFIASIYTAIIVTAFAVIGILIVSRWSKKAQPA